jgi:hypothetical protein
VEEVKNDTRSLDTLGLNATAYTWKKIGFESKKSPDTALALTGSNGVLAVGAAISGRFVLGRAQIC